MEIYERLRDTIGQADCWIDPTMALFDDKQLDGARHAASRAINLVSEGRESLVCDLTKSSAL